MGFLAPWFLAGLAALGVPVFVHLLRKHVTTPRPVSSLMFFERGIQSSTRHRRVRYLLLFALRSALLLLVVLAFANPFIPRATDTNGRLLLIVLDNSFSMREGTRFADAEQQALAVLAAKPNAQKAQVIALGGQLEVMTQPITDEAQLRSALESIQLGDGHANFGDLGRSIRAMAETARRPIDLHLFSDMQRTAMPANFADIVMPPKVALQLHDVAKGSVPPNWTVERVSAPAELADPKDPKRSRVEAVIAGFGTPKAEKIVSLVVNGKVIATHKVTVPANGRATVEFAPIDVGYGFNRCEVRIEGSDALPADDTSLFVIRRSDPERVLFVHAANDTRSPLYFGAALGAAGQASFILQSVAAEQTTDLDPSKFSFVVLSDAVALPSIFEHTLAQYESKGGSVLIALGTNAEQHARIPLWGSDAKAAHDYARTGGAAMVGQLDFTHPALEQE
jgi:Aerotolerance regulator N-terminal/von Willebrand factor type A domain